MSVQEIITEIHWDAIRVSPFQPRRVFSDDELEELAASIREVGLIHPPVVRAIQSGGKLHYYELIAGERRWRAAKKAGLKKLPVIIREATEEEAAKATLIENVQRVDLDPVETAHAFKRLIDIFRMTQEEVAERVGKKRSTVANYLRLLSLPKEILDKISNGTITMGHAKAILSLDDPALQEALHEKIIAQNMTVREAEFESSKLAKTKKKKKASTHHHEHLRQHEEMLSIHLGTKVTITPSSAQSGKVTIHYQSLDVFERLRGGGGL